MATPIWERPRPGGSGSPAGRPERQRWWVREKEPTAGSARLRHCLCRGGRRVRERGKLRRWAEDAAPPGLRDGPAEPCFGEAARVRVLRERWNSLAQEP